MTVFAEVAAGRSSRLLDAALEIAADEYPDLSLPEELAIVERLRGELRRFAESQRNAVGALPLVSLLNEFFFERCAFRGNAEDYYDPRNSYLNEVVRRRVGIPISLSVLYADFARQVELNLHGVNLPGHFVLGLNVPPGGRLFIDVFNGGELLDWDGCRRRIHDGAQQRIPLSASDFPPMAPKDVLARMLRNLKSIYLADDRDRAVRIQRRLVMLSPDDVREACSLGDLYCETGRPALALRSLRELLQRRPNVESDAAFQTALRRAARESALAN